MLSIYSLAVMQKKRIVQEITFLPRSLAREDTQEARM
jgi:hypothetical protein